jgi:hypothetical protein
MRLMARFVHNIYCIFYKFSLCVPVGHKKHEKNNIYVTKEFSLPCRKMAVLSAASTVACDYAATAYEQKIVACFVHYK